LTIAEVDSGGFVVSIIPHTAAETTLLSKRPGDLVNLENDMIGKYVERLMLHQDVAAQSTISYEFLAEHGF